MQNKTEKNYCRHWKEKKLPEEQNRTAYNRDAGYGGAAPHWHRSEMLFHD